MIFSVGVCFGQVETILVKPFQTDLNYSATEDWSAVSRNPNAQLNKMFLFIGETGSSSSSDYNVLRIHSANLGFDFMVKLRIRD